MNQWWREELRTGSYRPSVVKQRSIPKRGGKVRYLGIPTVRDRVVQAALKLVLNRSSRLTSSPAPTDFGRDAEPGT